VTRDAAEGLRWLQLARDAKNLEAEYHYAWLLIHGSPYANRLMGVNVTPAEFPPNPTQGLQILKQLASNQCSIPLRTGGAYYPAQDIGNLYQKGSGGADEAQADLWLARNLLHCKSSYFNFAENTLRQRKIGEQERRILIAAFAGLSAREVRYSNTLAAKLSEEERQLANEKAAQLRAAVKESERTWPAPQSEIIETKK